MFYKKFFFVGKLEFFKLFGVVIGIILVVGNEMFVNVNDVWVWN